MAERPEISVVLITRNEAARIRRCLDSVRWVEEIVVVDQHSRDATAAICREYGARVIEREMAAGFGEQKNFAIAQARRPWVLSLDADEEVTPALRRAIEAAVAAPGACEGFRMPRLTSYLGRFIRHCGWYPSPVLRLVRRGRARFTDALVHEEMVVDGPVGDLREDLLHHSYDALTDHVRKLLVYTAYDARMLRRRGARLGLPRALGWLVLKPPVVFVRKYVLQHGYREGWHGFVLSAMAALVVFVNAVRLAELTGFLGRPAADPGADVEPPTILLMANFPDIIGGGEESLLGLAATLDRRRLRVLASVTGDGEVATRLRALGVAVNVVRLPRVRPWTLGPIVLAVMRLRRLLRRERVTLVHAHGSRGALYAGFATRGLGVPLVWHVRVADPDPRLDRLLARLAEAIVVNSSATAARLRRLPGAAAKLTIVPNGVDPTRFAPGPADARLVDSLGLDPAVPVVGYFGRLERGKGVDVLVDAATRLHAKLPATAFLFVGEGPLREALTARAATAGLPACFVGQRDDVAALLRLCAVVVLPSRQEAFGRILIEAMAAGVPVVASAVGGIPEVCVDGVTGLLVPPEDADALAVAIALTLTDQAATQARVTAATADVHARFALTAHGARVEAVYARVLGMRGPGLSPRVGIDGRELRAGVRTGIRRYTLEVLRAATARGLDCVVYGDRGTQLAAAPAGVTPAVLPAGLTQWWDQVALPRALRRDGVDVFLSPYYKRPLAAPCPVVVTIHDLFFIGYPGRRRPLYDALMTRVARLYAGGASAIIADSDHSRRAIVARLGIAAERIAVIPVGLGPEFRPATPSAAQRERYGLGPRYALYVGNFLPHKNLPRLLRAWAALAGPLRAAHRLVLAGGDVAGRPALAALAATLGLGDRVVFAGVVDDADLPALYGGAAAVVLPSLEEGFGLPALEAMACGAPVVASRRGALPEVVGDAGVLVDPEDEGALAGALARVLGGELDRATLVRTGLARARHFTIEHTAGRVVDLLLATAGVRPALSTRAG